MACCAAVADSDPAPLWRGASASLLCLLLFFGSLVCLGPGSFHAVIQCGHIGAEPVRNLIIRLQHNWHLIRKQEGEGGMQKKALQMAGQVVCMLLAEIQPPSLRQHSTWHTETTLHAHCCSSQIAARQSGMLEPHMLHQQSQAWPWNTGCCMHLSQYREAHTTCVTQACSCQQGCFSLP